MAKEKTKKSAFVGKPVDFAEIKSKCDAWFAENGEHLREEFAKIGAGIAKTVGIAVATLGILIGSATLTSCDVGGPSTTTGGHGQQKTNAELTQSARNFINNCLSGSCGQYHTSFGGHTTHMANYIINNVPTGKRVTGEGVYYSVQGQGQGVDWHDPVTVRDGKGQDIGGGGFKTTSLGAQSGYDVYDLTIDYSR